MKTYFKIVEMILISSCFRWLVCVSSVEQENFYSQFYSPSANLAFSKNYSLHSRYIRDKRPSGLMLYRSHPQYRQISKTAPDTIEKYPVDVNYDHHVPNVAREAVPTALTKHPGEPSNQVNDEILSSCDTGESEEHPSGTIGDDEEYSTTRICKQTVFNFRGNERFHGKFRVTPSPLGFSSWKAPWPRKLASDMQVHPAKYFEDIRPQNKPPKSVNTTAYTMRSTRSFRKLSSPRREIFGYRGFKIIGAVVDMSHRPREEVYRNAIRGRVQTTPRQDQTLCSTTGYALPETEHHSSVKRSVEETTSAIDEYVKETTTLDRADIEHTVKEVVKSSTTESDRVRFFDYFDYRQKQDEEESEFGSYPELSSSVQTTVERPTKTSEAQHHMRRHIIETTSPSLHPENTTWHHHPYMALYIFEPEGIHCDAAGISAHWLVASAACLLQHVSVPGFGIQGSHATGDHDKEATYVTFCGDRWDKPERITYVRHVAVHPRYQKEDGPLEVAYNIGVVQVDSTMAACGAWRPLALWSHRVSGTSPAVAVGWRINRLQRKGCEGAEGCRPTEEARLTAHSVNLNPGKCRNRSRFVDENVSARRKVRRGGPEESMYCVSARCNERRARCAGAGVLLAGGRLLGMWLQERQSGADELWVDYSATWRASGWLRGAAREPPKTL